MPPSITITKTTILVNTSSQAFVNQESNVGTLQTIFNGPMASTRAEAYARNTDEVFNQENPVKVQEPYVVDENVNPVNPLDE